MIGTAVNFFNSYLSVGSVWQNVAMYTTLILLAKIVATQHLLLKYKSLPPEQPSTDSDTRDA